MFSQLGWNTAATSQNHTSRKQRNKINAQKKNGGRFRKHGLWRQVEGIIVQPWKKVLRRIYNTILRLVVKHNFINSLSYSERMRQNVISFNGIVESQSGSSCKGPQRDLVPIPLSQAGMSPSRPPTEFKNSTQEWLKKKNSKTSHSSFSVFLGSR